MFELSLTRHNIYRVRPISRSLNSDITQCPGSRGYSPGLGYFSTRHKKTVLNNGRVLA